MDAGTEVSKSSGTGANQPPRQSWPNTGVTETKNVRLIRDVADGFTYPTGETALEVTITNDGGTLLTVTISNISNISMLATPFASGVWVVHKRSIPYFSRKHDIYS